MTNEKQTVRREIIDAFVELMAQKPYMEITVTDIVKKANVARASFYRNFNSTSDVIDAIADDMFVEYSEDLYPTINGTDYGKWRELLSEHFYRVKQGKQRLSGVKFDNMSVIFTRLGNKIREKEAGQTETTIKRKYLADGKVGLVMRITKKWVDGGFRESPQEMVDFIMAFILKF